MAAEYIVAAGNPNVILCERGIRTFETYTRNTLDLAAVPVLHQLTHLPVIVDPSHATGKRWLVRPLALGGVAVGADGVMVEVHPDPDSALSDAEQQLDLEAVRRADGATSCRSTSTSAACTTARSRPSPTSARRRRRAVEALSAMLRRADPTPADRGRARPARLRGRAAAARRQVDQPPGADARAPRRGRVAHHGRGRRRRRPIDGRRSSRRSAPRSSARPARPGNVDYVVRSGGGAGAAASRGRRSTAATPGRACGCSRASSPGQPIDGRPRRRRVAPAAGRWPGSSSRCARWARRVEGSARRHASAADRGRPDAARGRSTGDAGAVGAGEVGDPARGAARRTGTTTRPRVGRDARPHRADAPGTRRAGAIEPGADGGAIVEIEGGDDGAGASTSASPATRRRRRSGSSPARSIRTPSSALRGVGVNPTRRAVDRPPARAWAPRSRRAGRGTADGRRVGEPIADLVVRSLRARGDRARRRPRPPRRSTRSRSSASRPRRRAAARVIRGAGELRHKESDRIAGIVDGPARARRENRASTATTSSIDGPTDAARRGGRQPRRPSTRDDLRHRRPRRRRAHHHPRRRQRRRSRTRRFFADLERIRS